MAQTTTAERIKELERELATRERVYPGWVLAGKLSQEVADHRLQVISDVLDDLRRLYPQPVQGSLFAPEDLPAPKPAASADKPATFYR